MTTLKSFNLTETEKGFLYHLLANDGLYIITAELDIGPAILFALFKRAWEIIFLQHEILRSDFIKNNANKFQQSIHKKMPCPITYFDLTNTSLNAQSAILKQKKEEAKALIANNVSLINMQLFKISSTQYKFIWNFHHILMDGQSATQIFNEVMRVYNNLKAGKIVNFEPPSSKKKVLNLLTHSARFNIKDADPYWKKLLDNISTETPLPQPMTNISQRWYSQNFIIPSHIYIPLKKIAKEHKITFYLILQAAWSYLLSIYSGTTDVLFATTRALPRHIVKNTPGVWFKIVPVRVIMTEEMSIVSLFYILREQYTISRKFLGSSPILTKKIKANEIFSSCITYLSTSPLVDLQKNSDYLNINKINFDYQSHYKIMLSAINNFDHVNINIDFKAEYFPIELASQVSAHLYNLFEYFLDDSTKLLKNINLISNKLNDPIVGKQKNIEKNENLANISIKKILENQVKKTPHALAVIDQNKQYTYAQLNSVANSIAKSLLKYQVKSNDVIAIFCDSGFPLIATILSILKLNAVFLPIDKNYPPKRVEAILEESRARFILYDDLVGEKISNEHIIKLSIAFYLNELTASHFDNLPDVNLACLQAYLIYTSGSTGKPKGIVVSQKALIYRIVALNAKLKISFRDIFLVNSSPGFDIAIYELLGPLFVGGRCVFNKEKYNGNNLSLFCIENNITVIQATPSQWDVWLDSGWKGNNNLKILFGGEQANSFLLTRLQTQNHKLLAQVYGPTEATIWSTIHLYKKNYTYFAGEYRNIGCALSHTKIYILDDYLRPVPIGVIGEIYISGEGLARYYLKEQEKNSFFLWDDGFNYIQLFRTRDKARWLANRDIEYIGRADEQIKFHGYRIEPHEIEGVIQELDEIKKVVVIKENELNKSVLVAYIVKKEKITKHDIQQYVSSKLPSYMIPQKINFIREMPLTISGKIDKKALLKTKLQRSEKQSSLHIQSNLFLEIFRKILNKPCLEKNQNIFNHGADSISAILITNEAKLLNLVIQPQWIFQYPTAALLTNFVSQYSPYRESKTEVVNSTLRTLPALIKCFDGSAVLFLLNKKIPKSIRSKTIIDAYPLTKTQKGLLAQTIIDKKTSYNCQYCADIEGEFDLSTLHNAWNRILLQFDLMRTAFIFLNNEMSLQVVLNDCQTKWRVIDVQNTALSSQSEINKILLYERKKSFDFEDPPLFRILILKYSKTKIKFVLTCHHAVMDGWSLSMLLKKLFHTTDVLMSPNQTLKDISFYPFKDYVSWLNKVRNEEAIKYWQDLLKNCPPGELIDIEEKSANRERKCKWYRASVSNSNLKNIKECLSSSKYTLGSLLQVCWVILLNRYGLNNDVVIGNAYSGRTIDLDNITERFGIFSNILPVRVKLDENSTIDSILNIVHNQYIKSSPFAYFSLNEIQSHLKSNSNLFNYPIAFENYPSELYNMPRFKISNIESYEDMHYSLALTIREDQELNLTFIYNDAISTKHIRQLARHYENLLIETTNNLKKNIFKLQMLCDEELRNILFHWNNTSFPYCKEKTIVDLFEDQVKKTPNHPAIESTYNSLTYKQLNEQCNILANYLLTLNVSTTDYIAIYAKKNLETIIAMIAIMKVGAPYIPIDPNWPLSRAKEVLKDSRSSILIGFLPNRLNEVSPYNEMNLIDLADFQKFGMNKKNPNQYINSESLIYTIYTSGTTGKPKGVMNKHKGLVNRLLWMQRQFNMAEGERTLHKTPLGFDVSFWEIMWPLISGGVTVVADDDIYQNISSLIKIIDEKEINIVHFVPSLLQVFIENITNNFCKKLSKVFSSGEMLTKNLMDEFFVKFESVNLYNLYGPTEAAIDVSYWQCKKNYKENVVPIGRPISNTQLLVLDKNFCHTPIGVTGILHIGGDNLALGYHNNSKLTKAVFIDNPFVELPTDKLYITGDSVQWLSDGNLKYIGREDEQIKLNGIRIELQEIERALNKFPFLSQAAVITSKEVNNTTLSAFVTLKKEFLKIFDEHSFFFLPHKLPIAHYHINETELLIKEIFKHKIYNQDPIIVNSNDIIFDIGANIGLFSIFCALNFDNPKIYAFEPIPQIFNILSANCHAYCVKATIYPFAIGNETKKIKIAFFPEASIMSTCYPNQKEDTDIYIKTSKDSPISNINDGNLLEDLAQIKVHSQEIVCQQYSLSEILEKEQLSHVDLIKLDVEKSELSIIQNLKTEHFRIIKQFVIETADNDRAQKTKAILQEMNFSLKVREYNAQQIIYATNNQFIPLQITSISEHSQNKQYENIVDLSQSYYSLSSSEQKCLDDWKAIYNFQYKENMNFDSYFNTSTWINSYTQKPFHQNEIQQWLNHTVNQILSFNPKIVLEIGCGMGMLLFKIAPVTKYYCATELSDVAIDFVNQLLKKNTDLYNKTKLKKRPAHVTSNSESKLYDTIILNSIIQYFPSLDYFMQVLNACVELTKSGGQVFIGDVRSLFHLEGFYTSIALENIAVETLNSEIYSKIQRLLNKETELIIDYNFFIQYAKANPRVSHVKIDVKRGWENNEMTAFRYDVTLHIEKQDPLSLPPVEVDLNTAMMTPEQIYTWLNQSNLNYLSIRNIKNQRLANLYEILKDIKNNSTNKSGLNYAKTWRNSKIGIHPEMLHSLAQSLGFNLHVSWSKTNEPDLLDAIFYKKITYFGQNVLNKKNKFIFENYATKPSWQYAKYDICNYIKKTLKEYLPQSMIPHHIQIMKMLPISLNGKLDKKSLYSLKASNNLNITPPQTPMQVKLINLWKQILSLDEIGINDNFFNIGGHSISAIRVIEKINKNYSMNLSLKVLFTYPTVRELSELIAYQKIDMQPNNNQSPLILLKQGAGKYPVFLIHPVGGTVFCYIPFIENISGNNAIYAIEDPAIQNSKSNFNTIPELATFYIKLIQKVQPTGPYYIGGASLGGNIAWEMTYQLEQQGENVGLIFMMDSWAVTPEFLRNKEKFDGIMKQQDKFLKSKFANYHIENKESWLELSYKRLLMGAKYEPSEITSPVHLFKAKNLNSSYTDHPTNQWQQYTKNKIAVTLVPGDHESILLLPNIKKITNVLSTQFVKNEYGDAHERQTCFIRNSDLN